MLLFPFLPTSSGSLTVSGCNLALTCPDQHISRERSTDHGRGCGGQNDGVDEGRGGVEGIHERKEWAGWRQVEKWKRVRMEEGEGWRPEEIGERKRSRLRGYWFLYKDPWIWCGRPWQRRSQPQETALGTDHYIITNIQTNTHRSFHWDVILFQWTADWLLL